MNEKKLSKLNFVASIGQAETIMHQHMKLEAHANCIASIERALPTVSRYYFWRSNIPNGYLSKYSINAGRALQVLEPPDSSGASKLVKFTMKLKSVDEARKLISLDDKLSDSDSEANLCWLSIFRYYRELV